MFRNYLKIAWRNLSRNRVFSLINIVGLAVGLACFLLIALYVRDELRYDRHHQQADQIYRMTRTFLSQDQTVSLRLCSVAPPFGPLVKSDFPEATQVVRMLQNTGQVRYGEHVFTEQNMFFAEANIFKLFTYAVVSGSPDQALVNPFSVMLSRPMAEKYFGQQDRIAGSPLGKTLRLNQQFELTVTGVYEPQPAQAHMHPDFLISFATLNDPRVYGREGLRTNWGNNSFSTYLLLPKQYDISRMEKAFPAFQNKHVPAYQGQKASSYSLLGLQKLTDIHLRSHTDDEIEPGGDIRYVYLFSAIGLFILLIACINYMNLATARSAGRAKEVGLRKVIGAVRGQLIGQFLSESVLLAILSLGIAIVLLLLGLPLMNDLTHKQLLFSQLLDPVFVVMLVGVTALTGLVAGSYPAFFLTAFQPIAVLKGQVASALKNGRLRQVLVIMQFGIAVALIISTAVVFSQLRYIQHYNLGYQKDQVVILPVFADSTLNYEAIKQELKRSTTIADAARSSRVPSGRLLDSQDAAIVLNDSLTPSRVTIKMLAVDHEFIPTYALKLAAGRNFSRAYATDDSAGFILNETAVKLLGWNSPQQAIGKVFRYAGQKGQIIGVTTDFHFESLHQQVAPLVLFLSPRNYNYLSVHVAAGQLAPGLAHVESVWKRYFPDRPFSYQFLDERFGRLYATEQTQQTLFGIFAGIAILISCLGLFGLSIFMAEQRTKEIGVRKVLGASVSGLVALLAKDLLKLVLIAIVVASPLAWMAMRQWLTGFAYPTPISPWVFVLTGVGAVLVAFLTVAYQSIKAALMNPVKSLKTE